MTTRDGTLWSSCILVNCVVVFNSEESLCLSIITEILSEYKSAKYPHLVRKKNINVYQIQWNILKSFLYWKCPNLRIKNNCCCCSVAKSLLTLCNTMNRSRPGLTSLSCTISQSLLKLMSVVSVMPFNHLLFCCPLLLLPSTFPSIRVFSHESALHIRWPKYWSFSISPSNEYSRLIFFRIYWFDLLAVERTLKSLLQHHISKASVPWCSAFFRVQLSHPYINTGKTIALTAWTFVGKVMSLFFLDTLSRFV